MKIVDYRKLRPNNITHPYFRHLLLLIYWPFYGLAFLSVERLLPLDFKPVSCAWDAFIPFNEWFVIPYYFWFVFLFGMLLYTGLFEVPAFKKMMWFIMVTYSVTMIIYIIFPNCQDLRPTEFTRDNILVDIAKGLYAFDTNTNVCPSIHILGAFACCFTGWHSKRFGTPLYRVLFTAVTLLICVSTLFMRQHSIVDVVSGTALSFAVYPFVYFRKDAPDPIPPWEETEEKVPALTK